MKLSLDPKWKSQVSIVAGLGGMVALVNLAPARPWAATGVPGYAWKTVAASADFMKLVAAGAAELVYGFDGVSPIYVSMDSGLTWATTAAPSNCWSAVAASADGSKLVATAVFFDSAYGLSGSDGLIYTSSDYGTSWTATAAPTNQWSSVASSADGTRLIAAAMSFPPSYEVGGDGLIYISADSGTTWTRTSAPSNYWTSVTSSADGTSLAAVAWTDYTGDGLTYGSTNSGTNWFVTSAPRNRWSSIASSADGVKLAAAAWFDASTNFNPGLVYVSNDSGQTWTPSSAPSNSWSSIAASAEGSKLIAGSSYGGIAISTNFGATWENGGAPATGLYASVVTSADGNRTLAAAGRRDHPGFLVASPYAGPWRMANAPTNDWASIAASGDGTRLVAAATDQYNDGDGLIYVSTNSGINWTATDAPSNSWFLVASSGDGARLVAVAGPIYISTNSGASWAQTGASAPGLVAFSSDGSRLVAGRSGGGICTSADFGATWTATGAPSNNWSSVASSADGTRLVAVASWWYGQGDGLIYTSTNAGANWTQTSAPTNNWSSVACSADGTIVVAAASARDFSAGNGSIYTSTNSGRDWVQAPAPFESWTSVAFSANGTELVAAANTGQIYISKDLGVTWTWADPPAEPWQAVAVSGNGSNIVAASSIGPIYVLGAPVSASPLPSSPRINIVPSTTGLKISWLVPSSKFTLQQASDLSNENWTTVSQAPSLNLTNLHYEMVVSSPASNRFYRLKLE
jgi:hypothetical protein